MRHKTLLAQRVALLLGLLVLCAPANADSGKRAIGSAEFAYLLKRIADAKQLTEAGQIDAAAVILRESSPLIDDKPRELTEELAATTLDFALAMHRVEEFQQARHFMKRAAQRYEKLYGKKDPRLVDIYITAAEHQGELRAFHYYKSALKMTRREYGRESAEFIEANILVADSIIRTDPIPGLSEPYVRDAYKLSNKHMPMDSVTRARATTLRGRYAMGRGHAEPAAEYFRDAIKSYEMIGMAASEETTLVRTLLAECIAVMTASSSQ